MGGSYSRLTQGQRFILGAVGIYVGVMGLSTSSPEALAHEQQYKQHFEKIQEQQRKAAAAAQTPTSDKR